MSRENIILWILISIVVLIILTTFILALVRKQSSYPSLNTKPNPSDAKLTYYYSVDLDTSGGASFDIISKDNTIYQTIYSGLYKDMIRNNQIGSYSSVTTIQNVESFVTCMSGNNNDISKCTLNQYASKSGFATLSIQDGDNKGTITYVLNNNPRPVTVQPTHKFPYYFLNIPGDTSIYDIVGGTESFLGKKGFIYVYKTDNILERTVYIYFL